MKRYKLTQFSPNIEEEAVSLPPRRSKHAHDRTKVTRWFYRILAISFIVLTIGLLLCGFLAPNE